MSYNNLIIFLTDRCRSRCSTCNVRAIPENAGMLQCSDLDLIFTDPIISEMAGKYIIWTGGEPFENFPALKYGVSIGAKNGFRSEILSSGYWFGETPELLERLTKKGSFSLRISIDSEHLNVIEDNTILMLMKECIDKKIELNFTVRDIPGDESSAKTFNRIREKFPVYTAEREGDPRWIHHIPHVPLDGADPYKTGRKSIVNNSGCKMVNRDLVLGWDGNLYPCCGLFSIADFKKYSSDNIKKNGNNQQKYQRVKELFGIIRENGPFGIVQKFDPADVEEGRKMFWNQCHACLHLLRKYEKQVNEFLSG